MNSSECWWFWFCWKVICLLMVRELWVVDLSEGILEAKARGFGELSDFCFKRGILRGDRFETFKSFFLSFISSSVSSEISNSFFFFSEKSPFVFFIILLLFCLVFLTLCSSTDPDPDPESSFFLSSFFSSSFLSANTSSKFLDSFFPNQI